MSNLFIDNNNNIYVCIGAHNSNNPTYEYIGIDIKTINDVVITTRGFKINTVKPVKIICKLKKHG